MKAQVLSAAILCLALPCVGCSDSGGSGCKQDIDCEGVLVCRQGECVHPCEGVVCDPGEVCVGGECVACTPDCGGRACGPDPVCGASCGECSDGEVCTLEGTCLVCQPDCGNRACGPDPVCNTSCGTCAVGESCGPDGQCEACQPACADRECGPDPACGTLCGVCVPGLICEDGSCLPASVSSYDVVVVGAGTGGCGAAIQAARMGMRVALLEETDWVGGQATAAGVSSMDESPAREREFGLYREFIDRVRAHYAALGKSVGTCYWSANTNCFEPWIGQMILEQMLREADDLPAGSLEVFRRTQVVSVLRSGVRVTGVRTRDARQLDCEVLIDATEYGDLLPLAGAAYRVGNSTSDAVDSSGCIQDITYTALIKKYPGGVPPDLMLSEKPPGFDAEAPFFARIVTKDGQDWFYGALPPDERYPVNFVAHNAYRGTPDSFNPLNYDAGNKENAAGITKTGVNYANDYPARAAYNPPPDNPVLPIAYLEDRDHRRQVNCEAKLRTLQFLYYVQHDLDEPLWSIADDEGYDTAYNTEENGCPGIPDAFKAVERHFPVIPYVRESRRMIGLHTLTAGEMARVGDPPVAATNFPDALAVCGYGNDLHNCNADSTLESAFESRADITPGGPFQVPFGSFIPEAIDGFLPAEKNLSQTRLVNGATRLQPSTLLTGQAAGALAAVAIQRGSQPRNVPPILVQDVLVRAGVRISRFLYTDVPGDDPAWPSVQIASTREILVGYGNGLFGRDDSLTRGQAAAVLVRLFELPVNPPQTPTFDDVAADHPFYGFIEAIRAAGITAGCSADPPLYCPDDPVIRVQLAVFLARGMGLDTGNVPSQPFFDDVQADHPLFEFVQAIAEAGIMNGCSASPPLFCPDDPALRVHAAHAAHRVLLFGL